MKALGLFIIFTLISQLALASTSSWKYVAANCNSKKATEMMAKDPNQSHFLNMDEARKLIEFKTVFNNDASKKPESYFYQYSLAPRSVDVYELQKVDVILSETNQEVISSVVNKTVRPFRYRIAIKANTLRIHSRLTEDGLITYCVSTYAKLSSNLGAKLSKSK